MLAAFGVAGRRIYAVASGPLPPGIGFPAPAFSARAVRGSASISLAQQRGSVVLLDFWATWCPPCIASMPELERIHREYQAKGVRVVGVNQEPDDPLHVRGFLERQQISFPSVLDPGGIAASYGVYSFPTSFLVGPDGIIRKTYRGPPAASRLRRDLEEVLAEGQRGMKAGDPPEAPRP